MKRAVYFFRILFEVIGNFVNLKEFIECISGKEGRKKRVQTCIFMVLSVVLSAFTLLRIDDNQLFFPSGGAETLKSVYDYLHLFLSNIVFFFLIIILAVILFRIFNFLYFYIGRKNRYKNCRISDAERQPERFGNTKEKKIRRNIR